MAVGSGLEHSFKTKFETVQNKQVCTPPPPPKKKKVKHSQGLSENKLHTFQYLDILMIYS